jgi:hypothetical protein
MSDDNKCPPSSFGINPSIRSLADDATRDVTSPSDHPWNGIGGSKMSNGHSMTYVATPAPASDDAKTCQTCRNVGHANCVCVDAPATAGGEFVECDTCRSKPGSPYLCRGCLHNRDAIAAAEARVRAEERAIAFTKAADAYEHACKRKGVYPVLEYLDSLRIAARDYSVNTDGIDLTSLTDDDARD